LGGGGPGFGGLPGLGSAASFGGGGPNPGATATVMVNSMDVNGLTAAVMMGQAPPPPGLAHGPLRGAIGTLSTPTAPANVQEMFNGVLLPVNQIRQAKRLYIGNTPIGIDQVRGFGGWLCCPAPGRPPLKLNFFSFPFPQPTARTHAGDAHVALQPGHGGGGQGHGG